MNFLIKAIPAPIENYSLHNNKRYVKFIDVLKRNNYWVSPYPISGDAPKDLIYVYEYGKCRKYNFKNWTAYIAKVGHKWYPYESITEQLITRLGQEWGFYMANSRLYTVSNQIRFCSEYFLKKDQELVHGADILSRYLRESDSNIIEQIDKKGWSQELLTLQFVNAALKESFPVQHQELKSKLVELLLFDAIVGNNDRHFFNWGIVRHLKNSHEPYFSPIYDSARGLFWNISEEKLLSLQRNSNQLDAFIVKYDKNSKPKMGWDNDTEINHYQMVERLLIHNECGFERAKSLLSNENYTRAVNLINEEFVNLISPIRRDIIVKFIHYRFTQFNNLLK